MIPPISIRPRRRTLEDKAISSVKDQLEDDPNNSVHEFKQIMEDIKRENPDLSVMTQQVLALEQCAKLEQENDDKLAQRPRWSTLPESLRSSMVGALKKLHIDIGQKESPAAIEREASEGWVDGVDISDNSRYHHHAMVTRFLAYQTKILHTKNSKHPSLRESP